MWMTICDNYIVGANGPGDCMHKTEKKIFEVYPRPVSPQGGAATTV